MSLLLDAGANRTLEHIKQCISCAPLELDLLENILFYKGKINLRWEPKILQEALEHCLGNEEVRLMLIKAGAKPKESFLQRALLKKDISAVRDAINLGLTATPKTLTEEYFYLTAEFQAKDPKPDLELLNQLNNLFPKFPKSILAIISVFTKVSSRTAVERRMLDNLYFASQKNNEKKMKQILEMCPLILKSPYHKENRLLRLFHYIDLNQLEFLNSFLEQSQVRYKIDELKVALDKSMERSFHETMFLLIKSGACPTKEFLHAAIKRKNLEAMKASLEMGLQPSLPFYKKLTVKEKYMYLTAKFEIDNPEPDPLLLNQLAVILPHYDKGMLSEIVSYVQLSSKQINKRMINDLCLAARDGNFDTMCGILELKPDLISKPVKNGFTALHYAYAGGEKAHKTRCYLLRNGADQNARAGKKNRKPEWFKNKKL